MNRFYLVRHGENRANLTKEFSHRLIDYPLTPKGQLQAEQTADFLLSQAVNAIYTSPLKRAVETAHILAERLGLGYTIMENFREINVGELERQPASAESWAFHNQVILQWLTGRGEICFPGGENYISLCERTRAGFRQIVRERQGQNSVVVGHGGIFTITLPDLCPGIDLEWLWQAENNNCSISEILVEDNDDRLECRLVRWASTAHLSGAAADLVSGFPEADTRNAE